MKVSCLHPFIREIPQIVDDLGFPVRQCFPCGKCPVCKASDAKDWMLRLSIEADNSINVCFLTLTYDEKNVVFNGSVRVLVKRDLQLFIKRLRTAIARRFPENPPIRFFGVGEYGGNTHRPHYHVILFNLPAIGICRKIIENCWNKGFITLSSINSKRIAYVANYSLFSFLLSDNENTKIQAPFRLMSRKPGIGSSYLSSNRHAYFNSVNDPVIHYKGFTYRIPRYFKDRFFDTEEIRKRIQDNVARYKQQDLDIYQNLYGKIDASRIDSGLPTVMEDFERHYLENLKKKYIIHKLHKKL